MIRGRKGATRAEEEKKGGKKQANRSISTAGALKQSSVTELQAENAHLYLHLSAERKQN